MLPKYGQIILITAHVQYIHNESMIQVSMYCWFCSEDYSVVFSCDVIIDVRVLLGNDTLLKEGASRYVLSISGL